MEIEKGMYVLPEAGKFSNYKLNLHLENFGYKTAPIIPGLWQHQTHPLQFSPVVDAFRVKYEQQADITHLLDTLKTILKIYEDWDGKIYCGINLEWYYYKR